MGAGVGWARPNPSPTPDATSSLRSTLAARRSSCLLVFSALLGLGLGLGLRSGGGIGVGVGVGVRVRAWAWARVRVRVCVFSALFCTRCEE